MEDLATLTPRAQAMLAKLPPYLADDDLVQRLCEAKAREFDRLETFLNTIREKILPQNADDEYGLLGIWERVTGVPVEPENISLSLRRARVMAGLRRRTIGIGEGWAELISLLLNTEGWEHDENNPSAYKMAIQIPFPSTSFQAGAVEALLKKITPAHLQLTISYSDTFRVGISEVGDPL